MALALTLTVTLDFCQAHGSARIPSLQCWASSLQFPGALMLCAAEAREQVRLLTRVMMKRTSTSRVGRETLVMWILGSIMPLVCGSIPHQVTHRMTR